MAESRSALLFRACRQEIEELHRTFESWFLGVANRASGLARVDAALAADFRIVAPSGLVVGRSELMARLEESWGRERSRDFAIEIVPGPFASIGPGVGLAIYQEWHLASGDRLGRLSSAVFRARHDAPLGVEWVHVHECWLADS